MLPRPIIFDPGRGAKIATFARPLPGSNHSDGALDPVVRATPHHRRPCGPPAGGRHAASRVYLWNSWVTDEIRGADPGDIQLDFV
jgi:hypothetical protein